MVIEAHCKVADGKRKQPGRLKKINVTFQLRKQKKASEINCVNELFYFLSS